MPLPFTHYPTSELLYDSIQSLSRPPHHAYLLDGFLPDSLHRPSSHVPLLECETHLLLLASIQLIMRARYLHVTLNLP